MKIGERPICTEVNNSQRSRNVWKYTPLSH